ncbi:MAG TPA: hypothetical protein EYH49_03950 [Aquifex aeolicus]|nr:hypothetical protein [Aquifex aeolicus]
MELWVKVGRKKKKLQGSMKSVMESLLREAEGKKTVELLSFHASQKERRRLKRELRANGKDLLRTASSLVRWFYLTELRKVRREIKRLRKRAMYLSKGDTLYRTDAMEEIRKLEERSKHIQERIKEL